MLGTKELLKKEIESKPRGTIIFIDDFASYESQWGVRFGLSSLAEDKVIIRLARGIYCYPRIEGEFKAEIVLPSPETIAETLAEKERVRIIPYGDQAAFRLGLTSMVVSDLKYLTDGAPRKINLSCGRKIYFNHTSEVKIFGYQNKAMQDICMAIRTLGAEKMDESLRRKIHDVLRKVPEKDFNKDITIPPAWVQDIVYSIWNN